MRVLVVLRYLFKMSFSTVWSLFLLHCCSKKLTCGGTSATDLHYPTCMRTSTRSLTLMLANSIGQWLR